MRISDWSSDVCTRRFGLRGDPQAKDRVRFRASLRSESGVAWRPSGRNKGGGIRRQADAGGHSPRRPAGRVGPARSRRTTRSGNAQSSAPRRSAALPADFGATRSDVEAEVQHVAFLDPVFLAFQAQAAGVAGAGLALVRSEEHTSELQSLMRISYAVFCLKKKT